MNEKPTPKRGQPGLVSWFGELLTEGYYELFKKRIRTSTKKRLLTDYDVVRLSRWFHGLFLEHSSHLEPGLQEILMQLSVFIDPDIAAFVHNLTEKKHQS